MKKILLGIAALCFIFSASTVFAETNISSKKTSDKKSTRSKASDGEAEKEKLEAEKRAELDNSEWSVTVVEKGGDYEKNGKKDKLIFKNGLVSFSEFESKGYGPANYTLVINPDIEGGTWETFVAGKDEDRLSIRGDWRKNIMNGTLVEQTGPKDSKTFYFTSQEKVAIAAEESKTPPSAAEASPTSNPMGALVAKESAEKRY